MLGVGHVREQTLKRNDIGRKIMDVQMFCVNAFAAAVAIFFVVVWVAVAFVILDEANES